MMRRVPLVRRTPLRRVSLRRLGELRHYNLRRDRFLRAHPFCQLWLAEHGVGEALAIEHDGILQLPDGSTIRVPCATMVHHRDKRRGARLLAEDDWMALSFAAHDRIEKNKAWARANGYLRNF